MSLKTFLEQNLKGTSLFKLARASYHMLVFVRRKLIKAYVGFLELLLPSSYFVQNTPNYVLQSYPDFGEDEKIYNRIWPDNQKDGTRIITAKYLLDLVNPLLAGDYAELGTYKGAFARLIFKYMNMDSELFCFDTFEGFASKDIEIEAGKTGDKAKAGFFAVTSIAEVETVILQGQENRKDKLKLVKGYFPDTFKGFENRKWRFVLLDADLYEPQKHGMELFWDNLVDGGIMMIHDFNGSYAGSRKAADEFFIPRGIQLIPVADKAGTAFIIKQSVK